MSLALLVVVVVVGIAAVVLSVHVTGGGTRARLADEQEARRRLADDFPDHGIGAAHLTADRASAFLELEDGQVGIVHAVGGKFLTRIVTKADLGGEPLAEGRDLSIQLGDFTWPGGTFAFDDAADAAVVAKLLAGQDNREER